MMKRVLVLGGGFAGVQAAIELRKSKRFSVTLLSDRNYLFLFPISIWVPTKALPFDDAKVSLAEIRKAHGFEVVVDEVVQIRSAEQKVVCKSRTLEYDYLIVAIGAGKVAHPGLEHTLSICGNPEMSVALQDRLERLIAKGSGRIAFGFGGNPKDGSAVRGGPAFELIFNVHTLLKKKGIRNAFELTFFAPMKEPGARMGKKALAIVDRMFRSYGIQTRYGKKIREFTPAGVVFEDDSTLATDLTMFIPGNAGHGVLKGSDLPLNEAGFIRIDDHGLVEGTSNVYAVGDAAALQGPEWRARQGHTAEVMARNAAFNIIQQEKGSEKRKGYQKRLSILCIMDTGNGAAFVYRDNNRNIVIPLPVIGHWMKMAWGHYARRTKVGMMPRIPGL